MQPISPRPTGLDRPGLPPVFRARVISVASVAQVKTDMKKPFTDEQVIGFLKHTRGGDADEGSVLQAWLHATHHFPCGAGS